MRAGQIDVEEASGVDDLSFKPLEIIILLRPQQKGAQISDVRVESTSPTKISCNYMRLSDGLLKQVPTHLDFLGPT